MARRRLARARAAVAKVTNPARGPMTPGSTVVRPEGPMGRAGLGAEDQDTVFEAVSVVVVGGNETEEDDG